MYAEWGKERRWNELTERCIFLWGIIPGARSFYAALGVLVVAMSKIPPLALWIPVCFCLFCLIASDLVFDICFLLYFS